MADSAARRVGMHESRRAGRRSPPERIVLLVPVRQRRRPSTRRSRDRAVAGHFPSGPTGPQRQRADVIGSEGLAEPVRPARRNWSVTEERALGVLEIDVSVVCPGRARRRHRDIGDTGLGLAIGAAAPRPRGGLRIRSLSGPRRSSLLRMAKETAGPELTIDRVAASSRTMRHTASAEAGGAGAHDAK